MANNANYPVWPGWKTVRLIGRGSFGAVYEIQRTIGKTTERSALKVIAIPKENSEIKELSLKGYDKASITERFQGLKESIEGEYATMAKLKGCANVVYCDDIRTVRHDDGMGWDVCIRMELLTPLLEYGKSAMDEHEIIRLGKELCSALVMCQKRDIVHRDIKPQNIFVSNDGTFKLGDFGIAKAVEHTTSGTMTGTYDYMAPEVEKHLPYNRTVDIYSLGMVLYWYLNEKRLPFLPLPPKTITFSDERSAKEQRLRGDVLPPPAHGSEELKRIVLKACAYDPKERYQSAEEMLRALEALSMPSAPQRITPPAEPRVPQPDPIEPEKPEQNDGGTVGVFGGKAVKDPEPDDDGTVSVFGRKGPDKSGASPIKKKPWGLVGGIAALLALLVIAFFAVHSWKPATCTEPETCKICGKTRGEALGHQWGGWTVVTKPTCTEDGLQERICANDSAHVETAPIPATGYDAEIGSYVVFGSYEQDNNFQNGAEDIEWLVLAKEGNRLLVISRYALNCKPYNTDCENVTWENCSLRSWLNETFLNTAFSVKEQAMISLVTVSADKNPDRNTNPGNDTRDKVFLLSITEANKYFSSNDVRRCAPTAYAKANGGYDYSGPDFWWWWLRSPGYASNEAALVDFNGHVYNYGNFGIDYGTFSFPGGMVSNDLCSVRPALWIEVG